KRAAPREHSKWCAAHQGDINFGYGLMTAVHREGVKEALLQEQGWICAYTGRAITKASSHIEHLRPQTPWKAHIGLDVDYMNLAACWPAPGHEPQSKYGARFKGDWPKPSEDSFFVSPLSVGCEARFEFNFQGHITAKEGDVAAKTTIRKLGLDAPLLTDLRRQEIVGVLGKTRSLKLADAKARLRALEEQERELKQGANVRLSPYCFALKQSLQKHIRTLVNIRIHSSKPKE
ncbi:MAG: retron system putative HNH endonuclease, partial [Verrucomicrobiaceae bacterium]